MKLLNIKWIIPWMLISIHAAVSFCQVIPDDPPFGELDSPVTGSTVTGAISVTGWVIDDNGGIRIRIYRRSSPETGGQLIFVSEPSIIDGLKPELIETYPRPQYYGGGFTWELLTHFLPEQGNGTYTLVVVATDAAGQGTTLGESTIICDNNNAVNPFGTLDVPRQGGIAGGDQYVNWGWVLTPQPNKIVTDGSTIDVVLDDVKIGHPNYGLYRSDIASLFPGYANSDSSVGYFYFDTTPCDDGLHTIRWDIEDNGANTSIIGNRYFYIYNGPEIQVEGSDAVIANGDTIPSVTDGTAFVWNDTTEGLITHSFAIKNQGYAPLTFDSFESSITVTGSAFSVTRRPSLLSIDASSSDTFDVTFDPENVTIQKGIVTIESNDADESPYEFTVIGFGESYTDSMALVTLYNSTHGESWTDHTNWLTGPLSSWFGITVSSGRVTEIDLENNNLSGTLPLEIGALAMLFDLNLKNNQLSGPIPSSIGNLSLLRYLYFNENQFEGTIPPEIGTLSRLYYLYLSDNQLEGEIPPEIGNLNNMTRCMLKNNQLSGPIPPEIGDCSNLTQISFHTNQFEGTLPPEFWDLTNMSSMSLDHNRLSGAIPPEILNMVNLKYLYINNNQFTDFPDLSSLSQMYSLYISDNRMTFEDIEPNINITNFNYSPQANIGIERDTTITEGASLELSVFCGGSANVYQWRKEGVPIDGAENRSYFIESAVLTDSGSYSCQITNAVAPDLTIWSNPVHVTVLDLPEIHQDSLALIDLYNNTDGDNWADNTNWLTGLVSSWFGVTVENNRVTRLELPNNQLAGIIPSTIGILTDLEVLDLKENMIADSMPTTIGDLANLQTLDLSENRLTGPIPESIDGFSKIVTLYLDENQLEGDIPEVVWNLTSLKDLRLNENQLTGTLPPEIDHLNRLEWLVLYENLLSGPVPPEIGNITTLTHVYLRYNQFEGSIPAEIGNCTNINELFLNNNQFTGTIPPTLGNLTVCNRLHLSHNQLTGSIPPEFGNCPYLWELALYDNQLEGNIPPEIGNITELFELYLEDNQLTGSIPPELFNATTLKHLRLNNNHLEEEIPDAILNCTDLETICLHHNQFSGAVPDGLSSFEKLRTIYLQGNRFTDLPDFSSLQALTYLYVEDNCFSFEDIEPNLEIDYFLYVPQDSVGEEQDVTVHEGDVLELSVMVGGTSNQYAWFKDDSEISGADSSVFIVENVAFTDSGAYSCQITNTLVPDLTLFSRVMHVHVESAAGVNQAAIPDKYALLQNYPNPFNPETVIEYHLPLSSRVTLSVYDVTGRLVRRLVTENQPAGYQKVLWDGFNETGEAVAAGMYIYRIEMKGKGETGKRFVDVKKMVLMK